MARFSAGPLPTDADEIWRYSRIGELDVSAFVPAARPSSMVVPEEARAAVDRIGDAAAVVIMLDGALAEADVRDPAVRVGPAGDDDGVGELTAETRPWDAFVDLNTARAPAPVVVEAPAGAIVDAPVVVCHWTATDGTVTFPRVLVRVGRAARITVVEYHLSADVAAWTDPVTEVEIGDGGHLEHLAVQELGPRVWQTAYLGGEVGRDAALRSFTVALGGEYARVRTDSRVTGAGGDAQLLALYCGNGSQMHDFRTLQDHDAPKSTSDLVFKGAVADEARSAYSGLIRVRRGAAGTRAFQTNRNLILSDTGLATYSVPNLDIEENDVSCSHASATGPIDPDQRFYLESRGVPTEVAERLIVLGFFDDLLERLPVVGLRGHLGRRIGDKLGVRDG